MKPVKIIAHNIQFCPHCDKPIEVRLEAFRVVKSMEKTCPTEQCPQYPAKATKLTQEIWKIAERTTNLQDRLILQHKIPLCEIHEKTIEWQTKKIRQIIKRV